VPCEKDGALHGLACLIGAHLDLKFKNKGTQLNGLTHDNKIKTKNRHLMTSIENLPSDSKRIQ
jgi:hypothetical protein